MDENLKYWFKGFEKAIAHMKQSEREALFGELIYIYSPKTAVLITKLKPPFSC